METVVENQDPRPLPEGWVQNYEPSKQLWYYVQMNVIPPKVSFTHPADLAPAGKQQSVSPSSSVVSGSRPGSSAGPSPLTSPAPLANISPQPKGRTFAQEFYASYLNKTMPPMINANGLTSLAAASGISQAQMQAQMDERRFITPSPASPVNWAGQNSASPPLRSPIPQQAPGPQQLPTPPHSSDESPVTSPAPYLPVNSNNSPNAQTNFGNVSVGNGTGDDVSKATSPLPYDASHQLHRAQSLQAGSAVPDHLRHAPERSQTFAPGQARQVGYNPNSAVSNGIPVNGLRQTPTLVTQTRPPSQSLSFTTAGTNPGASTAAQFQPNQPRNYTTVATNPVAFNTQFQANQPHNFANMATNHVNQMGASRGIVSVGSTAAQSPPTGAFSQTERAMAPLPSPPMSPPNNTSPTFTGSAYVNPTFNPQMYNRPKNQLTNNMGKLATKLAVGAASGLISQATGLSTKAVRSVGNIVTDPKVTAMFKGVFSRQNGPIGDKDLQAVLQGHPNANYQGVIDALIKQQQEFNTIQMQASMAYKPIPQSPVDYPALIAEVQRLQQQARVQAQAAQTQAQVAAAVSQSMLNNQHQSNANQLGQQIAQQGIQAAVTNQQAQLQILQAYLAAQGQQLQGAGLQQGQQQNAAQAQPQSAVQLQVQVPYGAPQHQQVAGQQQSQSFTGTAQPQQHQSPNAFVAQGPQQPVQHSSVNGGPSFAPGRPTAIGGGQTTVSSGGQSRPPGGQPHTSANQVGGGQSHVSGGQSHVSAGQIHPSAHTSQNAGQHPSNSGQQQQTPPAGGQPQTSVNQQNNGGQGENPYMKLYDQMQDMYQQVQQQQQQQQQPSYTDMSNSYYNSGVQQDPQQQQPSFTDMINSALNGNAQQPQQQPSLTDMINSTLNGGQQQTPLPDMINSAFNGNGQQQQPSLTDMINNAFNNAGQQPSFTDYLNSALSGGSDSNPPVYDPSLLYNDPSSSGGGGGIMDNLVQSFGNASLGGDNSLQTDTSGLNGFVNGLTQGFSTDQTDPSAFSAGFDLGSLGDSIASSITNSWSDSS